MIRRLLLMVVVVACTAPVLGGGAAPPVLVAQGVTVAGIPVGGMSYEQAQAAVTPAFNRSIRVMLGSMRLRVSPARFGMSVAVGDGVSRALDASPGDAVELVPRIDANAVQGLVPQFSDATIGRRVVVGATTKRLVRALKLPSARRVRIAVRMIAPKVTAASFGPVIVIRRGVNELRYYDGKTLVRTFGVATGQSVYPTPTGQFDIVDMQRYPWWRPPDSPWARGLKPIPPGPGNPLGTRWMGLSAAGVGIHGTPDDASIGYSASHGCIRMHIPDAEWLFNHVHLGTPVVITDA
ncbi:MAG: L,D-transpeptidase [Actinobacteria bacterium]|nr:MAG: L,D-transpeptidase [Actinomycetota bacterium]